MIRDSFIVNHCHHNDTILYYLPSPSLYNKSTVNIYLIYFVCIVCQLQYIFIILKKYCGSAKIRNELFAFVRNINVVNFPLACKKSCISVEEWQMQPIYLFCVRVHHNWWYFRSFCRCFSYLCNSGFQIKYKVMFVHSVYNKPNFVQSNPDLWKRFYTLELVKIVTYIF